MRRSIMILCLSLVLTVGLVGTTHAHPASMGIFFDGIDLDTGTVEYDRSILVLLMGETIEELLRPDRDYLADFSPSVDMSFEFDPGVPDMFDLVLQDSVKVAVLEDTSFEAFDYTMLGGLTFTDEPYSVSIDSDDLVVAWTAEDRYFKLGGFQLSDEWTIDFEIAEVVPEPSTLLLLGLGLVGVIAFIKRKKNIMAMLAIVLLVSFWGAEVANAQPTSLITVKKEGTGTGTILVGDQECDSDCLEMSVPYVDRRSVLLKVFPDPDSYFVRWKKATGESSQGAIRVQPGDTVIAVFGKKWVPFDEINPAEQPIPPEIHVPVSTLQEVVVDVDFPGMQVGLLEEGGDVYQALYVPGTGHTTSIGKPQVPALGRFIALPAGANVNVEVMASSFQDLEEFTVYPSQEPPLDSVGAATPPFTIDADFYTQDGFYPSEVVKVEGPFTIRGSSVVILRLFPVQVNPAQGVIRTYSNLQVKVNFTDGGSFFIEDRLRSSAFDNTLNNLLLNADTALASDATFNEPGAISYLKNDSLLIITPPAFVNAANTLAEWKNQKGFFTEVRTTNQTGTAAGNIQQFIQNAYDNWTRPPTYVLFIGDAESIPCHYRTWHPSNDDCGNCQGHIGTDLYYATVDGTDFLPDISLGRLSVDTLAQANNRVNAIIDYERNPPAITAANANFYTRAAVAAYFDDRNPMDGFADRRFALTSENIRDHLISEGYAVDRIYFTENTVTPTNWSNIATFWPGTGAPIPSALQKPAFPWNGNAANITAAVNNGRFLLTHRDHGDRWGWAEPLFTTVDVQALNNGNELPVVWSLNCETGWFDNETDFPNQSPAPPSLVDLTANNDVHFSEEWERNANGGAIGIIAATRRSNSIRNDRLAWGLMDAIWPDFDTSNNKYVDEPLWEMGPILDYGKLYMAEFFPIDTTDPQDRTKVQFELYHWFGDPTMQIWTGVPQTLNVSHPSTLPAGSAFIDVTVSQPDALICISKDGVILGKALSKAGTTIVSLSAPLSEGDVIHITVTKHNFRPYEGTGNVVPPSNPCQVTNENNSGIGSLRQVLTDAESSGCTTVTFMPGVSTITLSSQLEISSGTLTIDGGASGITVSGNYSTRIFYVGSGTDVTLQNLMISYGDANEGGGIYNSGTLTITRGSTVKDNGASNGGGIYNYFGTVTVNGAVEDNGAINGAGVYNYSGTITVNGVVEDNGADNGGGIYNGFGTLTIASGGTVGNNGAGYNGGGIYNEDGGTVTINGTVEDNRAENGGGIYNSSGTVTVNGWVRDNRASGYSNITGCGGGIYNSYGMVTINGTINDNTASDGGGVYNYARGATVTIESNGTISGNTASAHGGGISNFVGALTVNGTVSSNTSAFDGGGIYNSYGTVTVNGTVSSNTASYGGGIYNFWWGGMVTINGTVSGNTASDGGGIYCLSGEITIASGGRVTNNEATGGGGIYNSYGTVNGATTSTVYRNNASRWCNNYLGGSSCILW